MRVVVVLALAAVLGAFVAGEVAGDVVAVADSADSARAAPSAKPAGKPKKPRRVFFGGGLSFTFGTQTRVSVSPLVGYQISRAFSVGTQVSYDYLRQDVEGEDFTLRSYGASTFGRYHVGQFYAHIEPAVYDQELVTPDEGKRRHTVPYLFVGGGVFQPIAPGLRAFIQVTYDVLQDKDSPYRRGESFVTTGVAVGP